MTGIMKEKLNLKNAYIFAFFLSFIYVCPFIFSSIYYADDSFRSMTGHNGWSPLGRPLSDYILSIFSQSKSGVVDAGRLPLIISCFIMAHSIVLLCLTTFKQASIRNILVCSTCYITPFFVQNIAYIYDSLSMVVSLYLCIIAACLSFSEKKNWYIYSLIMLAASLSMYQTSIMAYAIILVALFVHSNMNNEKKHEISLVKGALVLFAALSFYLLIVAKLTMKTSRGESIFSREDPVRSFINNIDSYANLISTSYGRISLIILAILFISSIVSLISFLIKSEKSNVRVICNPLLYLSLFAIFIIAPLLPNALLAESLVVPRILTAFGSATFALLIITHRKFNIRIIITSIMLFISVISSFVVASTIKKQNERDEKIADIIYFEINSNPTLLSSKTTVIGTMSDSRSTIVSEERFPMTKYMANKFYDWTASMYLSNIGLDRVNFSFSRAQDISGAKDALNSRDSIIIKRKEFCIVNSKGQNYVVLNSSLKICAH